MPLADEEWERLKSAVERVFFDVARAVDRIAAETEAIRRISEGSDAAGAVGMVLEVAAETILENVQRIRHRMTLFERDVEDLRRGDEL